MGDLPCRGWRGELEVLEISRSPLAATIGAKAGWSPWVLLPQPFVQAVMCCWKHMDCMEGDSAPKKPLRGGDWEPSQGMQFSQSKPLVSRQAVLVGLSALCHTGAQTR